MISISLSLKPAGRWCAILISLAAASFLAGCASKEYSYATTVSGGQTMRFTIVAGRPMPAKAEGVEVHEAGLQPDAEAKKVLYGFHFSDSVPNRVWQNVRIEDVTDAEPLLLLEDTQPKLTNQHWSAKTPQFGADDPALKWVFYINDSVRVYRFTLTAADGHKVVLHQAALVPAWIKAAIRRLLGEKY